MATTEEYKNGGSSSYSFSIEYIKAEDIKVTVDGTALNYTATNPPAQTTEYTVNGTNVIFKQASVSGSTNGGVRIYRETELENADSVTFQPGSSIRAADLNANHKLVRFSAQEKNQEIVTADIRDSAVTSAKILNGTIVEGDLANSAITSNKIADNAVTTTEILNSAVTTAKIANDAVTTAKIANSNVTNAKLAPNSVGTYKIIDDAVTTAKIADSNVTNAKLATNSVGTSKIIDGVVTTDKLNNQAVTSAKIAPLNVTTGKIADDAVTIDKIADAAIVTNGEQASHTVDDNTFFTTAAAEARYFNASTGETIKNGDTFPDNDTTIATTAAINDRIIDLVDNVGGFVPIANETSFPTTNPDINTSGSAKGGTIVSVKTASTNLVPSGTTVTIANGRGSGLAVIITGVPSTIPSGFGFLVETTVTDHTYAFHRLTPNATEVTTVAGKATEIGRLGTADAVADMAILGTTDVVADMNTLAVSDVISDMNTLAVSDVISDMNTLAVTSVVNNIDTVATNVANVNTTAGSISNVNTTAGSISNVNTVAGSITNVNTTAGSIGNVNTVAGSIASVNNAQANLTSINNFGDQYQVASNNPTTDGGGNTLAAGDLYFNTSANELKVYNGSSWQGGVTAAGSFAATTGNTFTGDNKYNDGVKALFGTGSDLEVYHDGNHSRIVSNTGNFFIQTDAFRLRSQDSSDLLIAADKDSGVDLYFNNSKKLETISSGVKVVNLQMDDSSQAIFGTGEDLKIWHDGTNSSLKNDTGGLYIRSSDVRITNAGVTEHMAKFFENGAVELYYDNSKKLETTSAGATLTGNLQNNGQIQANLQGGIDAQTNAALVITSSTNNAMRANFLLEDDYTSGRGALAINVTEAGVTNDRDLILNRSGGRVGVRVIPTTEFEVNGTSKFNGAVKLGDNNKATFGTGDDLQIYHDGTNSAIQNSTGHLYLYGGTDRIYIRAKNDEDSIVAIPNAAAELFYDNSRKLFTTSVGAQVTDNFSITDTGGNQRLLMGNQDSAGANCPKILNSGNGTLRIGIGDSWSGDGGTLTEQLNITKDGNVQIPADNKKLQIGASQDLELHHTGSTSEIRSGSVDNFTLRQSYSGGYMFIHGDNIHLRSQSNNEIYFTGVNNGAAQLYYDNTVKLGTTSYGVSVVGDLATTGHVQIPDNFRLKVGNATNGDLILLHDGTDSIIDNATGNLFIRGAYVKLQGSNGENMLVGNQNTSTELYYDNVKQLETTSNGIEINSPGSGNGEIRINGSTGATEGIVFERGGTEASRISHSNSADLAFSMGSGVSTKLKITSGGNIQIPNDSGKLQLGTSQDLELFHNGSHSIIADVGTGNLQIRADDFRVTDSTNAEVMIKADTDGAVELYHNNTNRIKTTGSGVDVFGNQVHLYNNVDTSNTYFYAQNTSGGNAGIKMKNSDGEWTIIANDRLRFIDDDASLERVSILSSGGITFNGDTAAANALDDYEEGAWTPTLTFGGNSSGQSYDTQIGRYVKIGSLVHIQCYVDLSDKGSSTGTAKLAGLPFTTRNQTSLHPAAQIGWTDNCLSAAGPGGVSDYNVLGSINSTTLNIQRQELGNNGQGINDATDDNFTDSTIFALTMTYITN